MKRMILLTAFATPAIYADVVTVRGCNPDLECGHVTVEIDEHNQYLQANSKSKGKAKFLEVVASTTGSAIDVIVSTFESIRDGVLAAGYTEFKGELSGPDGAVNVYYNFQTGDWSVSGSSGGNQSTVRK